VRENRVDKKRERILFCFGADFEGKKKSQADGKTASKNQLSESTRGKI